MAPGVPTYAIYETDRMLKGLERDGFVFIPGVLGLTQVEAACHAIDALEPGHWDETGVMDRFLNVFNRDPYWLDFLDRPGLIDLAEAALGADCRIIGETAWRSHPGFRGEALHADYLPMTFRDGALPDDVRVPMFICSLHFYLTRVTPDLCPTQIIPGSHRAGRAPTPADSSWAGRAPVPVVCEAGDALLFRSDLWHRGSDNVTVAQTRYLLQVHYGRREVAPHFSPYLEWRFNPDVLRAATPRQRRLLGDHQPGPYD